MRILSSAALAPFTNTWNIVDGDPGTLWVGAPDTQGWWLLLDYGTTIPVGAVRTDWTESSPTNRIILVRSDAETWLDLDTAAATQSVDAVYIWIILPDTGAAIPPAIREIDVKGGSG